MQKSHSKGLSRDFSLLECEGAGRELSLMALALLRPASVYGICVYRHAERHAWDHMGLHWTGGFPVRSVLEVARRSFPYGNEGQGAQGEKRRRGRMWVDAYSTA